jgi:hypothetical protein
MTATLGVVKEVSKMAMNLEEFDLLKKSVLFGEEDVAALRLSHEVLKDQTEAILDVWYTFVGANPHLVRYFAKPGGAPDANYLAAVRVRFGKWILDTAAANYDEQWLDYQHEIGLRHHSTKKNKTDNVEAEPIIHLRYILALLYPITATLKPFLARKGHPTEDVERMHEAWIKSVLLQVILWSRPYVKENEY